MRKTGCCISLFTANGHAAGTLTLGWMVNLEREKKRFDKASFTVAVCMMVFSIAAFVATLSLPEAVMEPIGPSAFPRGVSVALFFLGGVVLLDSRRTLTAPRESTGSKERSGLALVSGAVTLVYAAVMELGWLGFRPATILFMLLLGSILFDFKLKQTAISAVLAVVTGLGLHYLFTRILFIDLPEGNW